MVSKNKVSFLFLMLFIGLFLAAPAAGQAAIRIMPLGDSITGSPGCWRALLWQDLMADGYTQIDFVGTLPGDGCGFEYDDEHDGHAGYLAVNIASGNQLPPWLDATNPDIVMMFLGTNDTWSGRPTSAIIAAFTTLLGQMRDNNPNMIILVAQITPNNPDGCDTCNPNVIALNAAIPGWAADNYTASSPIVVVDLYTGYDTDTDTGDGCHPNEAGNIKIAANWYPALTQVLDGVMPTPGPTTVPTPTPTPLDCSGAVAWNPSAIYDETGTQVIYNGNLYRNNWYSSGQNPEEYSGANEVWTLLGACGGTGPTSTPAPTPTPTVSVVLGDTNSDGSITIVDALLVAQDYVGQTPPGFNAAAADVNCDGALTIVDALMIAQYYVGLITQFCQ